jgi:two-component system chemotaxis sensor kinase CheA
MNGLELTESIRGNAKLKELPIVLVTSLDSREDRERGIELGANAYVVKSNFEQANFLQTIEQFV